MPDTGTEFVLSLLGAATALAAAVVLVRSMIRSWGPNRQKRIWSSICVLLAMFLKFGGAWVELLGWQRQARWAGWLGLILMAPTICWGIVHASGAGKPHSEGVVRLWAAALLIEALCVVLLIHTAA